MAVPGGLRVALRDSRRRLVLRRRRQALAWGLLLIVLFAGAGALVQTLVTSPPPASVPTEVAVPDSDGDGLIDAVENHLGSDPNDRTPRYRLPEAWVQRHGLSLSDAELADRWAAYPRPPESPPAYGPLGLPVEHRMTYQQVYAYGRPATWNESRDGPHDSKLDPTKWDVGGSGVPYSWLIHFGLDPFDVAALDRPDPTRNVTWTPREAYSRGLHPRSPDGDQDGLLDVEEERLNTSPRKYSTTGTGIADGWLRRHGFSLADAAVAYQDPDRDGLNNLEEFRASLALVGSRALRGEGLDPHKQSTSGGPIPDGWLARYSLDATDPLVHEKTTQQEDVVLDNRTVLRRLTVLDEYRVGRPPLWNETVNGPWMGGSDPTKDDTDSDGLSDVAELVGWDIKKPSGPKRVVSDPTRADTDSDGLTDRQERDGRVGDLVFSSTDPGAPDSDFDGLLDGEEVGIIPWRGVRLPLLDPNSDDTDADGLRDGEESAYWKDRHDGYVLEGRDYDWGPLVGRPRPEVALARPGVPPAGVLASLMPGGDSDDDGTVNVHDPDSDGDGLLDGWEVKPLLYANSPYANERARSVTDPANRDTDLDGLPDAWEIGNGLYDPGIGGWNLDPALWSSFHDEVGDGERDLDADSIAWTSFRGGVPVSTPFRATNKVEFQSGSNPNARSTAEDGIPDGWKIFWGSVYPLLTPDEVGDVYPGMPGDVRIPSERPTPKVSVRETTLIAETTLRRALDIDGQTLREASCVGTVRETRAAEGTGRLCVTEQTVVYDYRAAADNGTNPYLDDTDGDGIPDWWEAFWRRLGSGSDRVNPLFPDANKDPDLEGLPNRLEFEAQSDPYRKDTDRGGAPDDVEFRVRLLTYDPIDDVRALDQSIDTDRDGLADTVELIQGTDPNHPDTDRDGLLDGRSLGEVLARLLRKDNAADMQIVQGFVELGLLTRDYPDGTIDVVGERDARTDPILFSTAGDGVPDGWAVRHVTVTKGVSTGLFPAYSHGRPHWWNETQHGLWQWGYAPGTTPGTDRDGDGLNDNNGEDPIPVANPTNRLPRGHPADPDLSPRERLARGQAYGGDALPTDVTRPKRANVTITLDPLPKNVTANGTTWFSGNVTFDPTGAPIGNVVVVLSVENPMAVMGVAVSAADGSFRAPILVADRLPAPAQPRGVPIFGGFNGTGLHVNTGAALAMFNVTRDVQAFAWSYNESDFPLPTQDRGLTLDGSPVVPRTNRSLPQSIRLILSSSIAIDAPAKAPIGKSVHLNATLTDALGRPVPNANVTLKPGNVTLVTDSRGRVAHAALFPAVAGPHVVNASFNGTASLLPAEASGTVRLTEGTLLEVFAPPARLGPNQSFAIAGTLRTARGAPVDNATVRLGVGPVEISATTDATGGFAGIVALPPDAPLGNVTLQADYDGNATLDSSRSVVAVAIVGAPRWIAKPLVIPAGGSGVLVATLVDFAGKPLAERDAELHTPMGVLRNRTDAEGKIVFPLDGAGYAPGERSLTLRFTDPVLGDALRGVLLTTTTQTRLSLKPGELIRGQDAAVTGRLVDGLGQPLVRQPVVVTLGTQTTRVVTDARGDYRAVFALTADLRPGRLAAEARFAGTPDGIYAASLNQTGVLLRDAPRLVLDDDTVLVLRPVVEGRLATLVDEPLSSRQVRFRTAGGDATVFTDEAGRFRAFLTLRPSQALGPFDARITSDGHDLLLALNASVTLRLKDQGTLRIDVPLAAPQGGQVRLPYSVTDSQGRPVPDARLHVTLDGENLTTQLVDGVAVLTIPTRAAPGAHKLVVRVVSDVVAAPAQSYDLDVRRPTTLRLQQAEPIVPGRSGEIVVALTAGLAPLANQTLYVKGAGVPILVSTGADGVARIPVPAGAATASRWDIAYLGAGENGASSVVVTVGTAAAPTVDGLGLGTYGLIFLLVLLAGFLAAAYAIRKRREPPAAEVLRKAARRLRTNRSDVRALYDAYLGLLDLAGLDEDAGDTLTFGTLLAHFVDNRSGADDDLSTLTELFNKAVYAPEQLDDDAVARGTEALESVARQVRATAAAPNAAGAA